MGDEEPTIPKRDIPWPEIKALYLAEPAERLSVRALALRFGVSEKAIRKRAISEDWGERPSHRLELIEAPGAISPELAPTAGILLSAIRSVEEHRRAPAMVIAECTALVADLNESRLARKAVSRISARELQAYAGALQKIMNTLEVAMTMDRMAHGRPMVSPDVLDHIAPERLAELKRVLELFTAGGEA